MKVNKGHSMKTAFVSLFAVFILFVLCILKCIFDMQMTVPTAVICILSAVLMLANMLFIVKMYIKNRSDLEKLAFYDNITEKSNYNCFLSEARKILDNGKQKSYAVITFDIDKFKYVNDVYGYDTGDRVLKEIADSLEKNLNSGEICARIQSDCFVVLLEYKEQKDLSSRADIICELVRHVGEAHERRCDFVLAVGIYEIIDSSLDVQAMVDRAVIARKTVKGLHRTACAFYNDQIRSEIINEKKMESEMHTALAEGQFEVYYQPKYYIENLRLSGAEALVRWNRPNKGLIAPNEFINLFERNGFIVQIDLYVFTQVCRKLREWLDKGYTVVPVSINLSRKHIGNPIFINTFTDIMKQYNIPPQYVELELTENTIFEGGSSILKLLDSIHSLGCAFSMDDFGTGYSSLNMLKDIPVDVLKLDRDFLSGSIGNSRGREIIGTIVQLAKKLNIRVVAEGVEDEEQLEFLKSIECDAAQGFYLSKPISCDEFENILSEQSREQIVL